MKLNEIKCMLLDMDGTIYLEDKPIGKMKETLAALRARGIRLIFLTNNSSKTERLYREKLMRLGLWDNRDAVYSSGMAACSYVKAHFPGKGVYLMGTEAMREYFRLEGVHLTEHAADVAVLAYDTELTYEKLVKLNYFLKKGAYYIATHPDVTCPAEEVFVPDVGSFLKLFEASAERLPDVIVGKPSPFMGEEILRMTGLQRSAIAMVGDRLNTDILFALNAGFHSVLVLSGETTADVLAASEIRPEVVLPDLNAILTDVF